MTEREPCDHPSATGDEGPNVRHVVRWRCDACDGIHYSDSALANLRAELAAQPVRDAEGPQDAAQSRPTADDLLGILTAPPGTTAQQLRDEGRHE